MYTSTQTFKGALPPAQAAKCWKLLRSSTLQIQLVTVLAWRQPLLWNGRPENSRSLQRQARSCVAQVLKASHLSRLMRMRCCRSATTWLHGRCVKSSPSAASLQTYLGSLGSSGTCTEDQTQGYQRCPEPGTLVCFHDQEGRLLVVKPCGKVWELTAVQTPQPGRATEGKTEQPIADHKLGALICL